MLVKGMTLLNNTTPAEAFDSSRPSAAPITSALPSSTEEGSSGGETISIVQDEIGQQCCPYREFSVVSDQPHCSEFVHKVRDARSRRAHHFGKGLVNQHGRSEERRVGKEWGSRWETEHERAR